MAETTDSLSHALHPEVSVGGVLLGVGEIRLRNACNSRPILQIASPISYFMNRFLPVSPRE